MKLHYQAPLKPYAQKLRRAGNLAEVLLWQEIQKDKLGCRFLRQVPIDRYIVDFYCHSLNLAIEIDGAATHDSKIEEDKVRQKKLESVGARFLRFTDNEVRYNLNSVVEMIRAEIEKSTVRSSGHLL